MDIYTNENSFNPSLYITAHRILKTWNEGTATYQNLAPDNGFYESTVQSYRIVDGDNSFYTWDITRLANDWTEGRATNYGVLLKYYAPPADGSMFDSFFCSTNALETSIPAAYWPQMVYQYINTTGVEDYLSYHSQDVGYAGTVYTDDLTGNLTLINPILQTGGSLSPINVALVYNSNNVGDSETPYGKGWKLNWSQKIDRTIEEKFGRIIAKYIDSDGTEHYFDYDSTTGIFTDEINPKRQIIWVDSYNYRIIDDSGTTLYFTKYGTQQIWYLSKVYDQYGNYIQITRNSSNYEQIDKITSSGGNTVDFVYNSGLLTTLKYYDNGQTKQIKIEYDNVFHISKIVFNDATSVGYKYDSNYLTEAKDIDGYRMVYGYNKALAYRVNSVTEYGTDSTLGQKMTMVYESGGTRFTDVTNNRKYLYTFSANGTLKSVVDTTVNDGNGYGQYYEYNNGNTMQTKGMGNLTFESKVQKSTVNTLTNHSFENSSPLPTFQAWSETTGTASAGFSTTKSRIGNRSYKVSRPNTSDSTRALGYYLANVTEGKTYTFSAYVNTAEMTSQGKGASVYINMNNSQVESEYITEAKDEWQRTYVTFTSTYTGNISLSLSITGATGSVYFDNVQFEQGDLSEYNLIENAGFENWSNGSPVGWNVWGGPGYAATNQRAAGNYSLRFDGGITKSNEYQQAISVPNGKSGDTYVFSAFANGTSALNEDTNFSIMITFINSSSTTKQKYKFNTYITDWQKFTGVAKAPHDYTDIVVSILYTINCNSAYFDNIQLIKDNFGNTYTYDDNGNLISTVDLQNKEDQTFTYDGNNQLIKQTNVAGGEINYTYDTAVKQQLNSVSSGGIRTNYTYDSRGNALTSATYGSELVEGKYYYIQSSYYSKNLEASGAATDDGTNVILSDSAQTASQRWKLIKNSDGTYSLSPECAPNKLLSIEGSSLGNRVNVALYSSGTQPYQKLNITRYAKDVYRFDFVNIGYSIDCSSTNAYIFATHNDIYQRFKLIPVAEGKSEENPAITSSATYTSDGEYTATMTDSRGYTTSYQYNEDRGYITKSTAPNGTVTDYTYDSSELLDKVTASKGTKSTTVDYDYFASKQLKTITSPSGTVYGFTYDAFSRNDTIKVGSRTLSDYVYNSKGLLEQMLYGNGTTVSYTYDNLNRNTGVKINNTLKYSYIYDGSSRLSEVLDVISGKKIKYEYDILDRPVAEKLIKTERTNNYRYATVYADFNIRYDDSKNRVAGYNKTIEGIIQATDYVYGGLAKAPDIITGIKQNGSKILGYGYDSLNRLSTRTIATTTPFVTEYTYTAGRTKGSTVDDPTLTTTLIKTVKNGDEALSYAYNELGNIRAVFKNGIVIEGYTYDHLGQLATFSDGWVLYEYSYDNGGNITSVKLEDIEIKSYTYGDSEWKDLLTSFNGQSITYDGIGNPLTYRDGMDFTWSDGRKLSTITKGTDSISYTYNANGLRDSKTVNGTTTEYYWLNGVLQGQKTGSEYIIFLHDENGAAYGFLLKNGATESYYYYLFNAQGDVIGIIDSTGAKVVEYTYDPWGEVLTVTGSLASTVGQKNPIRYRGYYYDTETGLYLTGTRYYDPEIGRFINADGQINDDILGTNLFAYCGNNPVTRADDTGRGWWVVAGALIGGIAGGVTKIVSNCVTGEKWHNGVIGAAVGGAVAGIVTTLAPGTAIANCANIVAAFAGAAAESLTNEVVSYIPTVSNWNGQTATKKVTKENIIDSTKTVLNDTAVNGTISAATGTIAGKIVPTNNGWFQPKKLTSAFTGKYAQKLASQTFTQSGLDFCYNGLEYSLKQRSNQGQQPIITFFPDTEIRAAG